MERAVGPGMTMQSMLAPGRLLRSVTEADLRRRLFSAKTAPGVARVKGPTFPLPGTLF